MSIFIFAMMLVIGSAIASVLGLLLIKKKPELNHDEAVHSVADPLLSVVGTLYAVLLGFLIVTAIGNFDHAKMAVEAEANYLSDVFKLAEGLPDDLRQDIQNTSLAYAQTVVHEEWRAMEVGLPSLTAWEEIDRLWNSIVSFQPRTDQENTVYGALINCMSELNEQRRNRLLASRSSIDPVLWAVIICGAIITILFTYFFSLRNTKSHIMMICFVSITLSLNIFLLAIYNSPFTGQLRVRPDAFIFNIKMFGWSLKHPKEIRSWLRKSQAPKPNLNDPLIELDITDPRTKKKLLDALQPGLR